MNALEKLPSSAEIADEIARNAAANRRLRALRRLLRKIEQESKPIVIASTIGASEGGHQANAIDIEAMRHHERE